VEEHVVFQYVVDEQGGLHDVLGREFDEVDVVLQLVGLVAEEVGIFQLVEVLALVFLVFLVRGGFKLTYR